MHKLNFPPCFCQTFFALFSVKDDIFKRVNKSAHLSKINGCQKFCKENMSKSIIRLEKNLTKKKLHLGIQLQQ